MIIWDKKVVIWKNNRDLTSETCWGPKYTKVYKRSIEVSAEKKCAIQEHHNDSLDFKIYLTFSWSSVPLLNLFPPVSSC